MEEFRPGQVIAPHADTDASTPPLPAQPVGAPEPERQPEESPVPTPPPAPDTEAALSPTETEPAASWQFHSQVASPNRPELPSQISWTASEFIAHEKSAGWYSLLALGGVLGAAVIYFLTRDKITTGIVIFAALAMGIFASRKPNVQTYALDDYGLRIGQKAYAFQGFKSFSIAEEGAITSIVFMPLKRFMPPLTIYVAPDMEDSVVDYLTQVLPFEKHKQDAVDGLLKRIRF